MIWNVQQYKANLYWADLYGKIVRHMDRNLSSNSSLWVRPTVERLVVNWLREERSRLKKECKAYLRRLKKENPKRWQKLVQSTARSATKSTLVNSTSAKTESASTVPTSSPSPPVETGATS